MRTKFLQARITGFYFVANAIMGICLALGLLLLLAILGRYVATRAEMSWHVQYGTRSTAIEEAGFADNDATPLHHKSIYDNWLMVRFTIAFAGLA